MPQTRSAQIRYRILRSVSPTARRRASGTDAEGAPNPAHARPAGPMALGPGVSAEIHAHAHATSNVKLYRPASPDMQPGCWVCVVLCTEHRCEHKSRQGNGAAQHPPCLPLINTSRRGLADPPHHATPTIGGPKDIRNSQLPTEPSGVASC